MVHYNAVLLPIDAVRECEDLGMCLLVHKFHKLSGVSGRMPKFHARHAHATLCLATLSKDTASAHLPIQLMLDRHMTRTHKTHSTFSLC